MELRILRHFAGLGGAWGVAGRPDAERVVVLGHDDVPVNVAVHCPSGVDHLLAVGEAHEGQFAVEIHQEDAPIHKHSQNKGTLGHVHDVWYAHLQTEGLPRKDVLPLQLPGPHVVLPQGRIPATHQDLSFQCADARDVLFYNPRVLSAGAA